MALKQAQADIAGHALPLSPGPLAPAQGRAVRAAAWPATSRPAAATTTAASRRATRAAGHKHNYRMIDFRRDKDGIAGKVERLEYDPNRTAYIALVLYTDGERRYILAPKGVAAGDEMQSGADAPIKPGNAHAAAEHPGRLARAQHRAEARQGRPDRAQRRQLGAARPAREGEQRSRCACKSGETRKVHVDCRATIGEVGNDEHNLRSSARPARKRWRGIRPTVRGVGDEPGRPPARRRRRQIRPGQPAPGFAVGLEHQGQEDAHATSARDA